jgi:NitT/TauT family transport system permease protein
VVVGAGIIGLLYGVAELAGSTTAAFPVQSIDHVTTGASELPYYAVRSLLRMFIALGVPVVFTFIYGAAAGRSRRAAASKPRAGCPSNGRCERKR